MQEITLVIKIKPLVDGTSQILTDFPEDTNVAFICSHLENISNGLKKKVAEKVDQSGLSSKKYATIFANNLKIEDLI